MRTESEKGYDQTYQKKNPNRSFRLSDDHWNQIQSPKSTWVKKLVIHELQSRNPNEEICNSETNLVIRESETRNSEDHQLLIVLLDIFISQGIKAPIPKELTPFMMDLIQSEVR